MTMHIANSFVFILLTSPLSRFYYALLNITLLPNSRQSGKKHGEIQRKDQLRVEFKANICLSNYSGFKAAVDPGKGSSTTSSLNFCPTTELMPSTTAT
jgi:hypothetical protein